MLRWLTLNFVPAILIASGSSIAHAQSLLGRQIDPDQYSLLPLSSDLTEPGVVAHAEITTTKNNRRSIALRIVNHGSQPLYLSYVMDEYVARTSQGDAIVLDKEFLGYPDLISAGEEAVIRLSVPAGVPADVSHLIATLNRGLTVVVLTAQRQSSAIASGVPVIGAPQPPEPAAQQPGLAEPIAAPLAPQPIAAKPPTATVMAPRPPAPAPAEAQPDAGLVPVDLEVRQTFGSTLLLELRWNNDPQSLQLRDGDRKPFALEPGLHTLHLAGRMPPFDDALGQVPVPVTPGHPLQIRCELQPHLDGPSVAFDVWRDGVLIWKGSTDKPALRPAQHR